MSRVNHATPCDYPAVDELGRESCGCSVLPRSSPSQSAVIPGQQSGGLRSGGTRSRGGVLRYLVPYISGLSLDQPLFSAALQLLFAIFYQQITSCPYSLHPQRRVPFESLQWPLPALPSLLLCSIARRTAQNVFSTLNCTPLDLGLSIHHHPPLLLHSMATTRSGALRRRARPRKHLRPETARVPRAINGESEETKGTRTCVCIHFYCRQCR